MSYKKILIRVSLFLTILYLVLLIPEADPKVPTSPEKQPFTWNLDSLWFSLEFRFFEIRKSSISPDHFEDVLNNIGLLLSEISKQPLEPSSDKFLKLEKEFFSAAPIVGAYPEYMQKYFSLYSRIRYVIKNQSQYWDMKTQQSRNTLYRLLYGGRAAVEEIMLQHNEIPVDPELMGFKESSAAPKADILGVDIYSGDILISRGGAPTSALIARGNDYPGNFSHVALVYVDEKTHLVSIIESHIERGVTVSSLAEYLGDKKLRVMVLRLRSDLPQLKNDPLLPHKAAQFALNEARSGHIPYDFEMDFNEPSKKFCSEVAYHPYSEKGIKFWKGVSSISSPGIVKWLSYFGVKHFETHQPSDLEYDPQLRVTAEWRDPETLYKDHVDNAVIEAMLEEANKGKEIDYPLYMLPAARVIKIYSMLLNVFGYEGVIPEGMSPAAALRNKELSSAHEKIKFRVLKKAEEFRKTQHYTPPYWQLVNFASQAVLETGY